MPFGGISEHTLDPNGRVIIPRKMRLSLGETFVMTRGHGKSIYIFTKEHFGKIKDEADKLGTVLSVLFDPKLEALHRQLYAEMVETDTDGQGRVLITPRLRKFADIDSNVVIVGVGDRIEIWNPENWEAYSERELTEENLTGAGAPVASTEGPSDGNAEVPQTGSSQ